MTIHCLPFNISLIVVFTRSHTVWRHTYPFTYRSIFPNLPEITKPNPSVWRAIMELEHSQMRLLEVACGWLHRTMYKSTDFVTSRGSVLLTAPERMQHSTFFYSAWSSKYSGSGLDTYSGLKLRINRGKGSKEWNMREAMAELIPGSFCSLGFVEKTCRIGKWGIYIYMICAIYQRRYVNIYNGNVYHICVHLLCVIYKYIHVYV